MNTNNDALNLARKLKTSKAKSPRLMREAAKCIENLVSVKPVRERMPTTRQSLTRKFRLPGNNSEDDLKVYITVGMYEDGRAGEVFLKCDRQGSLASGAFDATAMIMSIALQYGVPLEALTSKLISMRFEPAGLTGDAEYPIAASVLDLLGRWLRDKFYKEEQDG